MNKMTTKLLLSITLLLHISLALGRSKALPEEAPAPLLNALPQRTTQQYIALTGSAQPGEMVGVYRNGLSAGYAEANASGDFSLRVSLSAGTNELVLSAADGVPYTGVGSKQTVYFAPLKQLAPDTSLPSDRSQKLSTPPVLNLSDDVSEVNPLPISGYADAQSTLQLFVNGRGVGSVITDNQGLFHTAVPLEDGVNTIYVSRFQDGANALTSDSMRLEYINPLPRSSTVGGTLSQSETWTSSGSPYYVTSNVIVPDGLSLTIQSGVEVRFSAGAGLRITGTLSIQGTASAPVLLTADDANPAIGDWPGISFLPGSLNSEINYAQIEWASSGLNFDNSSATVSNTLIQHNNYGVLVSHNSSPVIDGGNEIISNNYGLFVISSAATLNNTLPVVRASSIHSNGLQNYYTRSTGTEAGKVALDATGNWWGTTDITLIRNKIFDYNNSIDAPVVDFSGFLDAAGGMPAQTGAVLYGILEGQQSLSADTYLVLSDLSVPVGSSLSLPAGTTLQFSTTSIMLEIAGSLTVQGTAGIPVTLTSLQPTLTGRWQGVILKAGASAQFEHALVQSAINGVYVDGASVSISDSTIEKSSSAGVYFLNGGGGTISHSVLRNNGYGSFISHNSSPLINNGNEIYSNNYGIYVSSNASSVANTLPVVQANAIYSNGAYNYSARSSGTMAGNYNLNASGNWWGSTDVTTIKAKLYDHNDDNSSPFVDFSEFLEAADGDEALSLYDVKLSAHELYPARDPAVTVEFILNTASTAALEIVRESDDVVVFSQQLALNAGTHQFSWDGRDLNSAIVADGLYRARLSAARDAELITVDPPVPTGFGTVGLITAFPATMNPYRNEPFLLDLNVPFPVLIGMQVSPNNGMLPFNYLTNSFLAPGVQTIFWDGRSPSGQIIDGQNYIFFPTPYTTRPYVIHIAGAKPTLSDPQTVPSIVIKSDPYLITHSYEQLSTVIYRLDQDAVVSFKLLPPGIFDPADSNAISILDQQLQTALDGLGQPMDHSVEWRGYVAMDTNQILAAQEGVYTFTIEATSVASGQSSLYRGALQIRQ